VAKKIAVVVLFFVLLSSGSPVSAYCPYVHPSSCPPPGDYIDWDHWCAPTWTCVSPQCRYEWYETQTTFYVCTRGCSC